MKRGGERVAIVGADGLFPGAATLDEFWQNVRDGVDASREVPPGRWIVPPERAFDPRPGTLDRVVSTRGYFLDPFEPDLAGLDIDPSLVGELDVLFQLTLHIGNGAFRSAKMDSVNRKRVGAILGSIALPTDRISDLVRETVLGHGNSVHPLNRHVTGLPAILLARALGLGGTAFTLDAACASSLYAIKLAVDELLSGRADAMLAGGLSRPDCLYTQMGFSQLRALSPTGRCSPFDTSADGLVVGEGGGIFVLKRLSDALAHGDQILGVIAGIGLSNDIEGNLLSPASEGQLRAMRAAYEQAGWRPDDVDLIECHATGTPVGDAVEFHSLCELGRESKCVIGSVKSTVGHLLTGANAAGLMKVLLAFKHETLPPSANFQTALASVDLARSPFRVLNHVVPWTKRPNGAPRRAAISGFGFGGINAHLLIEEFDEASVANAGTGQEQEESIAVVAIATQLGETIDEDDCGRQLLGLIPDGSKAIAHLEVPLGEFPIPPRELGEMLPQQLLMLLTAADALRVSSLPDPSRTGIFIGLGLDLGTTNFHLRWWAGQHTDATANDDASPPLTANRTMGALASIAASRIARTFGCGGPSFTISSGELSGIDALQIAAGMLQQKEIDQALVGAVDLGANSLETLPSGDGAVALVLKRLSDARNSGDRIVAILEDDAGQAAERIVETRTLPRYGAAAGLMAVARGCFALSNRILPERNDSAGANLARPCYWLHDSERGPRRARIEADGLLDSQRSLILREDPASLSSLPPLHSSALFLLSAASWPELEKQVERLQALTRTIESASESAAVWWKQNRLLPRGDFRAALIVESREHLKRSIERLGTHLELGEETLEASGDGIFIRRASANAGGQIAFVFPGSGNHYADMGRELGLLFPAILERQERENRRLRSQYANDEIEAKPHPRTVLFAQVSFGTFASDLLRSFAIEPDAVLGYSLGESAGLFGMRVWTDRGAMLHRLEESSLFATDLAAPFNAARQSWSWANDRPIDWITGIVPLSADAVRAAIQPGLKAYVLIINTPGECVIGGHRPDVEKLVAALRTTMIEVQGVTTAHCEAAVPVRDAYWQLHHLPVTPLPGVRFYSGAWGKSYEVTSDSAADSILAGVLDTIDFPRVVNAAYADGVRTFIEVGPGSSCCRIIDGILRERAFQSIPFDIRQRDALTNVLSLLARLQVLGVELDLTPLYAGQKPIAVKNAGKTMKIPVRSHQPCLPKLAANVASVHSESPALMDDAFAVVASSQTALGEAHEAFLRFSTSTMNRVGETIALQTRLLEEWTQTADNSSMLLTESEQVEREPKSKGSMPPRALSREQCQEFAAGSIADVLGPDFAEADSYPTRVRLPDGPLMLVDRILEIEGEPRSMTGGRVVTEHRVHAERWYLDSGRIPTCVAVEAGQADLFLSGFLGIDFITRGLAVYRLLDAAITFHGPLPRVGDLIRYDIRIDHFFRQGETHLFRFRFESTVNGEPLLAMTDGCAGFFSEAELSSGKGIVQTALDRRPMTGKRPADWRPLVAMRSESLDAIQVDALRRGDLIGAFGGDFANVSLRSAMKLPGGMLKLVDRVTHLDPDGGRFGIGIIRAEADIHPDDWFLTCHFIDDMVMPGTLMYECCLHTLRIFLMRLGWVGEEGAVVCEPVPGVTGRLKCRGQVIASTKIAAYEVTIKEIGYRPEPYAIADALMYADGRPIVEMTNMSLRLSGLTCEDLERIWAKADVLFDRERILAFAIGKPSDAFGEPYHIFDNERVIARLPGPPYQFLDRIARIECEPWSMVAGGVIEAEYDVPADEWYFAANCCAEMPFSVLLEVALQPCGWLAAYIGSALTSPIDMSFRNLGGSAVQFLPVGPDIGTLTTTVKITRVSSSAGMIIQHYDYAVRSSGHDVYVGDTYFGFFSKQALANQVGLREFPLYQPNETELTRAWSGDYPRESPHPEPMLRMVDKIAWHVANGGPHGLGAVEGRIVVDPDAWFFKAHFYQDPVWPGSLGLESFLQLARFMAEQRWGVAVDALVVPALGTKHQWVYRGQVLPTDREVTVQAIVTAVDDRERTMTVEGLLSVDGRIIYRMTDFTVRAAK